MGETPKKQESPAKVEECSGHAEKRSKRIGTILPGVIRHTSHLHTLRGHLLIIIQTGDEEEGNGEGRFLIITVQLSVIIK